MLLIFSGTDVARAKAEALTRARGREVVRVGEGGAPFSALAEYLAQRGLFQPKVALIVDRPLETAESKELFLALAPLCAQSETLVIAIEPHLDAVSSKKLDGYGERETFDLPIKVEPELPSSFTLIDALQSGDRKRAWIVYRQLIDAGVSAEEIHGALAWSARAVVLAALTKTAVEAQMKPYPYGKAKAIATKIGAARAIARSEELVTLYHEARRGIGTLENMLEAYILKK